MMWALISFGLEVTEFKMVRFYVHKQGERVNRSTSTPCKNVCAHSQNFLTKKNVSCTHDHTRVILYGFLWKGYFWKRNYLRLSFLKIQTIHVFRLSHPATWQQMILPFQEPDICVVTTCAKGASSCNRTQGGICRLTSHFKK